MANVSVRVQATALVGEPGHGDVTGSPQNRTYLFAGITAQANPACVSGPAVLTRTAACPGALPGAAGTPG